MNFVADESVEMPVIRPLRLDGHDVISILESSPGIEDPVVLAIASSQNRILLTGDKDFGELVFRLRQATTGVILTRLAGLTNDDKAAVVSDAIRVHEPELIGAFTVIDSVSIRIRKI